jgi:hypothetical protein
MLPGFGSALFSTPNTMAARRFIGKRIYSVGSATPGAMRLTGQMLSMGITMVLFGISIGRARITPDSCPLFLKSMGIVSIIFATLCVGRIFASLARGRVR